MSSQTPMSAQSPQPPNYSGCYAKQICTPKCNKNFDFVLCFETNSTVKFKLCIENTWSNDITPPVWKKWETTESFETALYIMRYLCRVKQVLFMVASVCMCVCVCLPYFTKSLFY